MTVYDRNDWLDLLVKPAVKKENQGGIGIFYLNKEKASKYGAFRQLKGSIPTGEYSCAAEPPVQSGESHRSRPLEPLI